jgi:heptosyltransferase III
MKTPPRRVLVIVTRRIGDVLLATPVLRSLKRAWPDAAIDAVVFSGTAGVLAANADIAQILTIPERPSLTQHIVFIGKLFRRYDVALSLLPGDRPTLYAFLAGRKRVGLLMASRKESWKQRLLSHWVAYDPLGKHTVLTHLSVLEPLGVLPVAEVTPSWRDADTQRATAALAPLHENPYVVLHLYPKFNYKMWHDAGWLALARWITDRGLRMVLTGGNDPGELDYVRRIAAGMPGALNLAGQLTLNECASVIARATAYVGPDTALTHMAAALGVPTIALFGPTNVVKWGPWPRGHQVQANPWRRLGSQRVDNVTLLQGAGACVPCGLEGCRREVSSFSDCLLSLPAEKVIAAIEERLR